MPVTNHQRTTAENAPSMSEPASLPMPEQQEFHQHLRTLAQRAVRTVLELVMREELDAFIAKYAQRYPEAVRSLTEDEEHLFTFYAFPQAMHRHIQTTNAIESLESQCAPTHRSDRRVHDGEQLLGNRLGDDAGYPLAQTLHVTLLRADICS